MVHRGLVSGLAIVAVFGGFLLGRWAPSSGAGTTETASRAGHEGPGKLFRVPVGKAPMRGTADARVTIVEFCDPLTEACRALHSRLERLARKGRGDVRLVFRANPSGQTMAASDALAAAHLQGEFWPLLDRLLRHDALELSSAQLEALAREAGVDMARLTQELEQGLPQKRVRADMQLAAVLGVADRPTVFINGVRLDDPKSQDALERVLTREMARAEALERTGVPRSRLYVELTKEGQRTVEHPVNGQKVRTVPRRIEDPDAVYRIDIGPSPIIGPADALVTIVEFGDFECPFCARAQQVLEELITRYGDKIRLAWRHNPLSVHPHAMAAAEVAMAASEQGKFWQMHEGLLQNQRSLERPTFERLAREVGLDMARFEDAFESRRFQDVVRQDRALAAGLGVRGTPTFFLNGRKLRGVATSESLSAALDQEIQRAEQHLRDHRVGRSELYESMTRYGHTEVQYLPEGARPSAGSQPRGRPATIRDLLPDRAAIKRSVPSEPRRPEQ